MILKTWAISPESIKYFTSCWKSLLLLLIWEDIIHWSVWRAHSRYPKQITKKTRVTHKKSAGIFSTWIYLCYSCECQKKAMGMEHRRNQSLPKSLYSFSAFPKTICTSHISTATRFSANFFLINLSLMFDRKKQYTLTLKYETGF